MNCALCRGEMESRLVTFTQDLGKCVVVVRNVPAQVCTECGNIWYSGTVVKHLEAIVDIFAATAITEVAVVNYAEQVA